MADHVKKMKKKLYTLFMKNSICIIYRVHQKVKKITFLLISCFVRIFFFSFQKMCFLSRRGRASLYSQVGEVFSPSGVTRNCSLQFFCFINNEKYEIRHFQVKRCICFGPFRAIWRVKTNGTLIFATKVIWRSLKVIWVNFWSFL